MRSVAVGVLCLAVAAGCVGRGEPEYSFTELTVPDAAVTVAVGINAAGHVVGWFRDAETISGYLYKDGTYTTIAYPGAIMTQLNGISDAGEIVGSYRNPEEAPTDGGPAVAYHGFLRTAGGDLLEIRHPDHLYTVAQRILPDGTILGCFHDHDWTTTMRGISLPRRAVTGGTILADAFEVIEREASMHNGGTPDGRRIVGIVMDTDEAYILEEGRLTMFMAPGAVSTEAWDINPSGVIVGTYADAASVSHGFVLENGRYTTLDVPGAKNTVAFGINARGEIVGGFEAADGQRRGFIARRQ
jgi:uncharacterized membrane protein